MLGALQAWFHRHEGTLRARGIAVQVRQPSSGFSKNGISADLTTDRAEATVELWESGESEFHYLDWQEAEADKDNAQAAVTHYEFARPEELFAALDALMTRMAAPQAVTV